jgi:hypothetical protein
MTSRHRLSLRVLAPGIVGLVLMTIAFVVKAMGSGTEHRHAPIDVVQFIGSALIVLSAVLVLIGLENNRESR